MTREEAIKIIGCYDIGYYDLSGEKIHADKLAEAFDMAIEALQEVQKHEETFEWCTDCKEYDKDNYCCHRWSKVIRDTVKELKADDVVSREEYNELLRTKISFANATSQYSQNQTEQIAENVKVVVRCKDCKWYRDTFFDTKITPTCDRHIDDRYGTLVGGITEDSFCSYGERKEPLPQYEEWQDEFNKMCESARPKTFVADEWYRDTFGENNGK